jgi:hypothetical protein
VFRPGAAEAARFKQAFEEGEAHFVDGDFGAAIASFVLADRQRVTPEVAYDLAKCHEKVGDRAFSLYYYRLYLRRAPAASDTLEVAQRVGTELGRAQAAGQGFVELEVPRAGQVTLDGRAYPEGPVAAFVSPGEHEVAADFPSGRRAMRLQVRAGTAATVRFEPVQPPLLAAEQALSEGMLAAGLDAAPAPGPSGGLRTGSYLTAGAGVLALAAGVVLSALAASDNGRLQSDRSLSAADAQALASSATGKGLASSVLFGAGGAAVAAGVAMFVVSFTGAAPTAAPGR